MGFLLALMAMMMGIYSFRATDPCAKLPVVVVVWSTPVNGFPYYKIYISHDFKYYFVFLINKNYTDTLKSCSCGWQELIYELPYQGYSGGDYMNPMCECCRRVGVVSLE